MDEKRAVNIIVDMMDEKTVVSEVVEDKIHDEVVNDNGIRLGCRSEEECTGDVFENVGEGGVQWRIGKADDRVKLTDGESEDMDWWCSVG